MKHNYLNRFLSALIIALISVSAYSQTTFNYTGSVQTYTAPATGKYSFEVWGAKGGDGGYYDYAAVESSGGLGGYSYGEIFLSAGQTINIYVGGQGGSYADGENMTSGTKPVGGWNGGGTNTTAYPGAAGGGATDIRVEGTDLSNRVIVAGGGGGGGNSGSDTQTSNGGHGGGLVSTTLDPSTQFSNRVPGSGGTQSSGNALGIGADETGDYLSGGGGGGYWGGTTGDNSTGGGGGSGYIGGVLNGTTTEGVNSGDGYATITKLCDEIVISASATSTCPNSEVTLSATSVNGGTIAWDNGVTNGVAFIITETTTYTAISTSDLDCETSITITVEDNNAPVADAASLDDLTGECSVAEPTAPTATDACSGTITGVADVTWPVTAQGTTTVTWTFDDGSGNTSTQTQDVIIDDVTAPVADAASLADLTDECTVAEPTAPTATDNCAGSITGVADVTWPLTAQGTTVVTWTFDDGNGNTSTQTQNVVIEDLTAPVPDAASLADATGECVVYNPYDAVKAPAFGPTATDNCSGTIYGTTDVTWPITTQGTTVVTWTYDDGNGNTSTQTQNVIIEDVTAPVPDAASLDDLTGTCSVDAPAAPTATDNCTGTLTGVADVTFPVSAQGTTVVTWTFDDGNGNTSTQTQNVILTDVTDPVADAASLPDLTDECSVEAPNAPTATDECAGSITGVADVTFPVTTQGTTVITWTFEDNAGNSITQTQNVIIEDVTDPVPDLASLPDISAECSVDSPTAPTATDNCAGSISATTDATFPISTQGSTSITWTYDDGNGNTITQTQNVVIDDLTNPSATCPGDQVTCDGSAGDIALTGVSDNCSDVLTVSYELTGATTASGSDDASSEVFAVGVTTVTYSVDDGNDNVFTCSFDVTYDPVGDITITETDGTLSTSMSGTYQWIDCSDNSIIGGETNATFTPTENGEYAVIVDNGNCVDTSACTSVTWIGISGNSLEKMIAYPNPTKDKIMIDLGQEYPIVQLAVYDLTGKLVQNNELSDVVKAHMDMSGLTPGIYLIKVQTNQGSGVLRVTKE